MPPEPKSERRARRRTTRTQPLEVRLGYLDGDGVQQLVPAQVVDVTDSGLGLQVRRALAVGIPVSVVASSALLPSSDLRICPRAYVQWCRPMAGGLYRVGLMYQSPAPAAEEPGPAEEDYYEILQVNPKASAETIHRVYRLLAQHYHPDNRDTGDERLFRSVLEAYQVLSDPERRAAYDLRYQAARTRNWQIFHSPDSVQGVRGEQRRRFGVLRALYAKRAQDARQPDMSIPEMEGLLGVPREHLEFTLWYLKERGYITRADNIRFSITAAGVEHTENLEETLAGRGDPVIRPQLPAPGPTATPAR
jgi:hypothetical protein